MTPRSVFRTSSLGAIGLAQYSELGDELAPFCVPSYVVIVLRTSKLLIDRIMHGVVQSSSALLTRLLSPEETLLKCLFRHEQSCYFYSAESAGHFVKLPC